MAGGGRPQIGTSDEKVPNLLGSKRKSGDVQQNQTGVETVIIQQPESNNRNLKFLRTQYECIVKLQEIIFEPKQKIPQGDFKTGSDILKTTL